MDRLYIYVKKELTGFNGSISSMASMVEVVVAIGKWKACLPFYVLDHGAHHIIGYPGLKALHLSINYVLDSLVGEDGDRVLYNVVRVSNHRVEKEKTEVKKKERDV